MVKLFVPLLMSLLLLPGYPAGSAVVATKRIIIIETISVPVVLEHSRWFIKEMAHLGYVAGDNAVIEIIKGEGDKQRAITLLRQATARGRPDVVVTFATLASQAAHQELAGTRIPQVFAVVVDPVGAGLVKKVGVPSGTRVTGLVHSISRKIKVDMAMRLLAGRAAGRPVRFGIVHSSYPSARSDVRFYQAIAKSRGDVEFIAHEFAYQKGQEGLKAMLADYRKGVDLLRGKVDYWWQVSGPLGEVSQSTALLLKAASVPLIYGNTLQSVKAGALFTINPDFRQGGRETARMVHAVLQGSDPGSIPVLAPRNFNLGINLSTALRLKITIPSDIMTMAGQKVFR